MFVCLCACLIDTFVFNFFLCFHFFSCEFTNVPTTSIVFSFSPKRAAAHPSEVSLSILHVHILTCTPKQLGLLAADNAAADRKRGDEQQSSARRFLRPTGSRDDASSFRLDTSPLSGGSSLCRSPHRSHPSRHKPAPPPFPLFLFFLSGSMADDFSADILSLQNQAMHLHFFFHLEVQPALPRDIQELSRVAKNSMRHVILSHQVPVFQVIEK